ncbi:helix-turn-helix domain-containing protein [Caulobacter sp. KR2-114]|uniref:helix-turn-helix domain-containing protein n=1 Tax=Caulobacter sp. KR2-114 TaxID=3400912 RepID=UPI003C10D7EE
MRGEAAVDVELSNLGAVGLVAREQPTLREALAVFVGYIWAHNQARAVPGADPEAGRRLQRYVELEAGAAGAGPAAVARDLAMVLLPSGTASVERVAALMGVSRRTLCRRLAEAGTSFERLLDDARAELAAAYAAAGRLWTEIAGLVGNSSLSALSRARRRWAASSSS